MAGRKAEYEDMLTGELERHGVTEYRVERGRKHDRLYFTYRGRDMFFVFPSSPSDRRSVRNSLTDLRKLMGVKRVVEKSARRKPRAVKQERTPACPQITAAADPFDKLKGWEPPKPTLWQRLRSIWT